MSFTDYRAELIDERGMVLYMWQVGPVSDGDTIDLKLPAFNAQGLWVRITPAAEGLQAALAKVNERQSGH